MFLNPPSWPPRRRVRRQAFSLVELLAVMAIIVLMLSLLAPAVSSFQGTAGRAGAVTTLMNTMEQARVAALESGRTVHLVFHRRAFPENDRIMVLREQEATSTGATPSPTPTPKYEAISRWIKLPKGVLLHSINKQGLDILSEKGFGTGDDAFSPDKMPVTVDLKGGESLNALSFNAYGAVASPAAPAKLMLIVTEGVRDNNGGEALISPNKNAGGFEIISLRRYTGRASLEVTTL